MAHPKHEAIRQRYQFRRGYCGVSEADAGGELTVDHHQPVSAGGGDEDDNLVYACVRCNLYKGEYFPDVRALAAGHRVLHPLRDNITDHVREDIASQRLEGLTDTGRFHVDLLRLNRPPLIQRRLHLRFALLRAQRDEARETENAQLRRIVASQRATILLLRRLLEQKEEDQNP